MNRLSTITEIRAAHLKMVDWTRDLIVESARKHQKRSEWKKIDSGAYKAAKRLGYFQEATAHMPIVKRNWTMAELQESADQYATRGAWKLAQPTAYKTAMIRGLVDDLCKHMGQGKRPNGTWTKKNVLASAVKFHSIAAWASEEISAYNVAKKNGWIAEATSHMRGFAMPIGPSIIHKYLLTHNIGYVAEHRFKDDKEVASKPFDFFVPSLKLIVEFHGKQHQRGWRDDAQSLTQIQLHDSLKKAWALKNGFDFLEIKSWESSSEAEIIDLLDKQIHTSAQNCSLILSQTVRELTAAEKSKIQSGFAFTEDEVFEIASQFKTRSEWLKASPKTYRFALRHGLAKEASTHMLYITEHQKWTVETILQSAKKYKSYSEWRRNEGSAYVVSRRLNCSEKVKEYYASVEKH